MKAILNTGDGSLFIGDSEAKKTTTDYDIDGSKIVVPAEGSAIIENGAANGTGPTLAPKLEPSTGPTPKLELPTGPTLVTKIEESGARTTTINYDKEGNIVTTEVIDRGGSESSIMSNFSSAGDADVTEIDNEPFKYFRALFKYEDDLGIGFAIDDMKESITSPSYFDDYFLSSLRDDTVRCSEDSEIFSDSVKYAYSKMFFDDGIELIDGLYTGYYSEKECDGFPMSQVEFQLLATAALANALFESERKRRVSNAYWDAYYEEGDYYSRNITASKSQWAREQSLVGIKGNALLAVIDLHAATMESDIKPSESGVVLQKLPGEAQG